MAVGCPAAWTFACGGWSTGTAPGSGPSSPPNRAPRPIPGSSATRISSPIPPNGAGPVHATTVALAPVRSSPACARPVTSQPLGSGHGDQSGTREVLPIWRSASALGCTGGWNGATAPCWSHCHSLDQSPGACSGPPQRGQLGSALMVRRSRRRPASVKAPLVDDAPRGAGLLHDLLDDAAAASGPLHHDAPPCRSRTSAEKADGHDQDE